MAKDPLANMMAQAVKPGSVPAPGGKTVAPPKGVQKTAPTGFQPGKSAPPPPPPASRKPAFGKPKK
jgi:hypothetical protein